MVVLVSEEVPRIHWVQWLRHVAKREEHWSFFFTSIGFFLIRKSDYDDIDGESQS